MIVRLWCRLIGHKWVFVPGVSHGDDELFECLRCGAYDWRDTPAAYHTDAGPVRHIDGQAATAASGDGVSRERPAAAGQPARVSRR